MYGLAHDSGPGIPILGSGPEEVRTIHDLGMYGLVLGDRLPVVFLGVFFGIQLFGYQWVHRQLTPFWPHEYPGDAFAWIASHSGASVLVLPSEFHSPITNRDETDTSQLQFCATTAGKLPSLLSPS